MKVYDKRKALFSKKDANEVHKSTLKHIWRSCVSDTPFECYYSLIREDMDGLTICQCHWGTTGNEVLHQRMRQLVQGFTNSPNLLIALLTDFFLT